MAGSGRWVADFVESFWDHPAGDMTFDMLVRGGMRAKGFVVSKIVATLTTPNYQVACCVHSNDSELKGLSRVVHAVRNYMAEQELEWAWLVIPRQAGISARARSRVERNDERDLGIALVDLASQEIVASRSYVGRRMSRFITCFR